jgi:hypothetical protein
VPYSFHILLYFVRFGASSAGSCISAGGSNAPIAADDLMGGATANAYN